MVKDKGFYKELALLSAPIAAQNVITYLVGLADNIMVGRLGETAVSGVYIANQVTTLLQMLVTGVSAAMMVLAAQYWGKRDADSVKSVTAVALRFCLAVSACLWVAMFFFRTEILSIFSDDAEIIAQGASYVAIICFTYVPFCLTNVLVASMRCVGNVRLGTRAAFVALLVNLFFNWVLIFGNLGMPRMGVRGAAVATLVSRIVELTIVTVYVLRLDENLKLRPGILLSRTGRITRDFLKYGSPVIAGDLLWGLNIAAQGAIIGHLGAVATTAVSIANTVFALISVGSYGIRDGSAIIIGRTVGKGEYDLVKKYAGTLQIIFVGVGIITGSLILSSSLAVPYIYSGLDAATIIMAKKLLYVLSVTVVGTSYQMATLTGIVRAGGATHFVLVNDMIHVWLIVIPSALIAAFVLDAPAWVVYACLKSDQILKCTVAFIKCNRYKWMRNLTNDKEQDDSEKKERVGC